MILRCTARRAPHAGCGYWLATVPDGSAVAQLPPGKQTRANPGQVVIGCGKCGALYAVTPALTAAA